MFSLVECARQAVLVGEESEDPFLQDFMPGESQPLVRVLDLLTYSQSGSMFRDQHPGQPFMSRDYHHSLLKPHHHQDLF